jgi:hypothetical protein
MVLPVVNTTQRQSLDLLSLWIKDALLPVSRFSAQAATKKGGRPLSHPPSEEMLDAFKAPLPLVHSDGSGAVVYPPEHLLSIKTH